MSEEGVRVQRLILKGGLSEASGLVVRIAASVLFVYVAARLFGAERYGIFVLATAVIEVGVAIAAMGCKSIVFGWLDDRGERRDTHVIADFALVIILTGTAVALAIIAGSALMMRMGSAAEIKIAIMWLAPALILQALSDLFLAATRWKHLMRYQVLGRSIVEPYCGLAATLLAFQFGLRESGLLIGYWIGSLALCGFALTGVFRAFGSAEPLAYRAAPGRLWRLAAACATPMAGELTKAFYFRLDVYIVGMLLGTKAAGIYGMARQFRSPARQVRQSLDGMLTPMISRTLSVGGVAEATHASASATRLTLAIQLPILIALAALGATILTWLGPDFTSGYGAMCILILAEIVLGAFSISDLILIYRKPALLVGLTGFMILINMLAAVALTQYFGIEGAAAAVLISVSCGTLARRWLLHRYFGVAVPLFYSAPPVVASLGALSALAGYFILVTGGVTADPLHNGLALLIALSCYALILGLWLRRLGSTLRLEHFRLS